MKTTGKIITVVAVGCVLASLVTSNLSAASTVASSDTVIKLIADTQGLEPVAPKLLPKNGTFWLVLPGANGVTAPLPCPPDDTSLPIYQIGNGQFLIDDTRNTPAAALTKLTQSVMNLIEQVQARELVQVAAMAMGLPDPGDGGSDLTPPPDPEPSYLFDTNVLWLEIANVTNSLANLKLHQATAPVYAIWTTTNLLTPWQVETAVWPTNVASMPFTLPTLGRQTLFVRAQDWTGVDGNSNSIPDWWEWKYLTNLTGTNVIRAVSTALVDVSNAVAQAAFGQTVFLPAGTNAWNQTLNISGISLIGLGTNLSVLQDNEPDVNAIPGSYAPMIHMVATNKLTRLSNLTLATLTNSAINYHGKVSVSGLIPQWRIDHCVFNQLYGDNIVCDGNSGLIDHNSFYLRGTAIVGNGTDFYGDLSWASPPSYGSISNLVVEDNWFTNIVYGSSSSAVFDGYSGVRSVFRFNQVYNTFWANHGTESSGRYRGTREFEIYKNVFYDDQSFVYAMQFRSGSGVVFSNSCTGYKTLAGINNYRNTDSFNSWGGANGFNPWDSNSPTVFATGTHSGSNNVNYLQVAGSPWTSNQWVGYTVVNTNVVRTTNFQDYSVALTAGRFSIIIANSTNRIYFHDPKDLSLLTFTNGDHFKIFFCYPAIDQIGRGSGDLLGNIPASGPPWIDTPFNTTTGTNSWPHQVLEPLYVWGNMMNGTNTSIGSSYPNIKENRDFYNGTNKPSYVPLTYPHLLNQ